MVCTSKFCRLFRAGWSPLLAFCWANSTFVAVMGKYRQIRDFSECKNAAGMVDWWISTISYAEEICAKFHSQVHVVGIWHYLVMMPWWIRFCPEGFREIWVRGSTLPETNSLPIKMGLPKRKLVFQPSIFRCYVSFREGIPFFFHQLIPLLTVHS